jgi:RimJ/RimL family protein N-acetyltransferase
VTEPVRSDGVVGLRTWSVEDAQWYAAATCDPMIQRYISESPTVTADEVRAAISALIDGQPGSAGFLVCTADTGARLGNVVLEHHEGVGHVSHWPAAEARGRGAATAAQRLVSAWAFEVLGLVELRLWTHRENTASRRVAERAAQGPGSRPWRQVNGIGWPTVAYRLPAPVDSNRAQISSTSLP